MTAKKLGEQPADRWETSIPEGTALTSVGLTKRELFAGLAMNAILKNNEILNGLLIGSTVKVMNAVSILARFYADELLTELAATDEQPL